MSQVSCGLKCLSVCHCYLRLSILLIPGTAMSALVLNHVRVRLYVVHLNATLVGCFSPLCGSWCLGQGAQPVEHQSFILKVHSSSPCSCIVYPLRVRWVCLYRDSGGLGLVIRSLLKGVQAATLSKALKPLWSRGTVSWLSLHSGPN